MPALMCRALLSAFAAHLLLAASAAAGESGKEPGENTEPFKPVVATVNGELVTEYQIAYRLGVVEKTLPERGEEREKQLRYLREIHIKDLVVTEIIVQASMRLGVKITDAMVRQEIKEETARAGGTASFHSLLKNNGLSYAEKWEAVKRELYILEYQRKLAQSRTHTRFTVPVPEIQIRPSELRAYYERHPEDFQTDVPGLFRLIRLVPEKFESAMAARAKADALHAELAACPAGPERAALFARLAREHSHGTRAATGGAWELKDEVEVAPELHRAVVNLKPGELSGVISTEFGYFLLFLEIPRGKKLLPFEKSVSTIEDRLRNEKWRAKLEDSNEQLLKEARIWPDSIAAMIEGRK